MTNQLLKPIVFILFSVIIGLFITQTTTREGFWTNSSRVITSDKVLADPNSNHFYQTPSYQALLSPRFNNADFGANLRTRMPEYNRLGVPSHPLNLANDEYKQARRANQSYKTHKDNQDYAEHYNPNKKHRPAKNVMNLSNTDEIESFQDNPYKRKYVENYQNTPPGVVTMASKDGIINQPIIYDRYIYSNRDNRLRSQGDPIRGDLVITPLSGEWFVPAAARSGNPSLVLQQGAMNVMSGIDNENGKNMASFIYKNSGGAMSTVGGTDLKLATRNAYGSVGASTGDVIISSFP